MFVTFSSVVWSCAPSVLALHLLLPASAAQGLSGDEEPVVAMDVLADVSHITPGAHFQLAVRFAIPAEWHIYWENQGNTGLPTRVAVSGPEGFTVSEALYPGPQRFDVAGAMVSYGYENEVCLLVPVAVPLDAEVGSNATFTVDGSWLVCKEACYRQSASFELVLPIATHVADEVPRPTHFELFKRWRQRLPRPQAELAGATSTWSDLESEAPVLELRVADCDAIEFFPTRTDTLPLKSAVPLAASSAEPPGHPGARLEFDARVYGEERLADAVRGVVRVQRGNQERFYRFAVPLPSSAPSPAPGPAPSEGR